MKKIIKNARLVALVATLTTVMPIVVIQSLRYGAMPIIGL